VKKAFILFGYAIALYFVLRAWYQQGNSGIPNPKVIGAPTYLYGVLGLVSDFTGGFTVPLTAGVTVALALQANKTKAPAQSIPKKLQIVPPPANPSGTLRIPPINKKAG
jgi:hypothetical protein